MEQYKRETEITDMDGFVTMAAFTGAKKEQAAHKAEEEPMTEEAASVADPAFTAKVIGI